MNGVACQHRSATNVQLGMPAFTDAAGPEACGSWTGTLPTSPAQPGRPGSRNRAAWPTRTGEGAEDQG